jgi:hypothetical protein
MNNLDFFLVEYLFQDLILFEIRGSFKKAGTLKNSVQLRYVSVLHMWSSVFHVGSFLFYFFQ